MVVFDPGPVGGAEESVGTKARVHKGVSPAKEETSFEIASTGSRTDP